MFLTLALLYFILPKHGCKIIRTDNNGFIARFTLVDSDVRLTSNCIRNITRYTEPQECSAACIREKNCVSINRHRVKGFCELLAISKFNQTGLIRKDFDWVHYETDDDEQNVGPLCTQLSPCKSYEICEDTLKTDPAYICRCRDGFEGSDCKTYKGPGSSQSNPAASCYLLLQKFKSILDGEYWFQGKDKAIKCERRVDGGYTPWTSFGICTDVICGSQQRNRTCTDPKPKGGGRSCAHLGPDKEMKRCYPKEICADCSFELFVEKPFPTKHRNLFATFGTMLKEFKVKFDFKVNLNLMAYDTHYNVLHFTLGKTSRMHTQLGERMPAVNLIRSSRNGLVKISMYTGVNTKERHHFNEKNPSFFDNWIHIEIVQQKISNKYILEYLLNGSMKLEIENKQPKEYQDMILYLSSNDKDKFIQIKNLFAQGYCNMTKEQGYKDYLADVDLQT